MKDDYKGIAALADEIAKHKSDPADMIVALGEYLKKNNLKEEK